MSYRCIITHNTCNNCSFQVRSYSYKAVKEVSPLISAPKRSILFICTQRFEWEKRRSHPTDFFSCETVALLDLSYTIQYFSVKVHIYSATATFMTTSVRQTHFWCKYKIYSCVIMEYSTVRQYFLWTLKIQIWNDENQDGEI